MALIVTSALGGCVESRGPVEFVPVAIEDVVFDPSLEIDLSVMTELPSGIYVEDVLVGTGTVIAAGDTANIDQRGWLTSGFRFSEGTFSFEFGADPREVIEGVEIGMEGMAVGGRRVLIIPPDLAFGDSPPFGSGIPRGAIVVYGIELLSLT